MFVVWTQVNFNISCLYWTFSLQVKISTSKTAEIEITTLTTLGRAQGPHDAIKDKVL